MTDPDRILGKLEGVCDGIDGKLDAISDRLDAHVEKAEGRLRKIEEQLSVGRFLLFMIKAGVLTVVAVLTLKFGDIVGLWRVK